MFGQKASDFEVLAQEPKNTTEFPLDYKIALPTLELGDWDDDYNRYQKFLNKALTKTQMSMNWESDGVRTWSVANSIIPHAQLDTSTMLKSKNDIIGTWRMVSSRFIKFNDSVSVPAKRYYRKETEELHNFSEDDVFLTIDDNKYKMFAKEKGESKFKKKMQANYSVESNRFIMIYKGSKASAGVSQIGIDENGYLILNKSSVTEYSSEDYISYYTSMQQYIFEKVK